MKKGGMENEVTCREIDVNLPWEGAHANDY